MYFLCTQKQPVVSMLGTSINKTEKSFDIVCYFLFPGISPNGSKLVELCGDHLDQPTKKPTYSIGNEMTIVFRSDNNTNHYRGFLVSVQPGKKDFQYLSITFRIHEYRAKQDIHIVFTKLIWKKLRIWEWDQIVF